MEMLDGSVSDVKFEKDLGGGQYVRSRLNVSLNSAL